jgi:hypothetical protein
LSGRDAFAADGHAKGVPDLVILQSGQSMGLEVKSPGETLSREQKEFRIEWERAGGIYAVLRSVEEGKALLEKWGVAAAGTVPLGLSVVVAGSGERPEDRDDEHGPQAGLSASRCAADAVDNVKRREQP